MGRHAEARFRRTFHSVRVHGLETLAHVLEAGPCIVVSNHTSWWDPMLAIVVANRMLEGCDGYALMDARNLRRLPFLGRLGGFGFESGDAGDGALALRYAARLLRRPRVLVWIFPQGRERPVDERPLAFQRGAAALARLARVPVVPAALRYQFGEAERPTCYASFGPSLTLGRAMDGEQSRLAQEHAVETELARIAREVGAGPSSGTFASAIDGRRDWLSAWAERALARLSRYRG